MPRILRSRLAGIVLALTPLATSQAQETRGVVASVESSLTTNPPQIRQYAFDGNLETYFASKENPKTVDHLTLSFARPVRPLALKVVTGKPDGTDQLGAGSLQISTDGKEFEDAARFIEGTAEIKAVAKAIVAIRIKPTADLTYPLVVREITVDSAEPVATFAYPVEFTVDVADAPEMKEWADKAARLCEKWYPRINEELRTDGYRPPTQISMALKSSYNGVAQAAGTRITGSVKFFKEHPDDLGAMIHETCHVVQRYRSRGNPGWLVEGVADYFRFFIYEPGKAGPVNPQRAHYNGSYRTTATFLDYVSNKYDKALVMKLNKLMREGKYKEEVFQELTGKNLKELDEEWLASLAK